MSAGYVPDRGDIVWISLSPHAGHEQAGRRPALVVSPRAYNGKVGLVVVCPVTSRVKGYPFEVAVPEGLETSGVVLSDQMKSLDWGARGVEFIHKVPESITIEVIQKFGILLSPTG